MSDKKVSADFTVSSVYDLSAHPQLRRQQQTEISEEKASKNGHINASVTIPRGGSDEHVPLSIVVSNSSKHDVARVGLTLVESVSFVAFSNVRARLDPHGHFIGRRIKEESTTLASVHQPLWVPSKSVGEHHVSIVVPVCSNSFKSAYIRLQHHVKCSSVQHDAGTSLKGVIPGAQVTKLVTVDCSISSYAGECAGYVGVAPRQKAIFLVFRGTRGFVQLIVETGQTSMTVMQASPIGGRVSSYFLSVFNKLWARGLAAGLSALKTKYPTYELWVTGHSLGGALASIYAGVAAKQRLFPSARIRLVTLGQPRTGDAAFAAAIGRLVPESYRVVHGRDIVPHVPPLGFLGYRHHKSEVWYDNNEMGPDEFYAECVSDGLADCSNPDILNFNALDHVEYFGLPIPGICPNTVVSIF